MTVTIPLSVTVCRRLGLAVINTYTKYVVSSLSRCRRTKIGPLINLNHLNFYILRRMIAKTLNLMYRLNVQVTAYGRQTVPDRGVVEVM